jgi:hypothetical protein
VAEIHVADHQFHIVDYGGDYSFDAPPQPNGLINPGPGAAVVVTGTPFGPVAVAVEIYDCPPELNLDDWDEVIEVSLYSFSGQIGLQEIQGPQRTDLPVYESEPDDWLRVRAHVRGRDEGDAYNVPPPHPVEEHLVQFWLSPHQDEIRHRLSDQVGQRRRRA